MEKPAIKPKNKILKILPKAAQGISLHNPFSPRRDNRLDVNAHRLRTHHNKGFSGPMVSMIPAEARRKPKNFETPEPTSPKVSCMGQIKHKNKISKNKHVSLPKECKPVSFPQPDRTKKARPAGREMKKSSGIRKLFVSRKPDASIGRAKPAESCAPPRLSQMRRFASSRETFANFDWTAAQIAPEVDRGFYSDEEREYSDGEDDIGIPFSAPILSAGGGGAGGLDLEPKKEINLWKRRTMAQPKPLQLS